MYYVIGGPYVSDQAGLNRGPLIQNRFHCYFVYTFCKDRIKTFLILILHYYKLMLQDTKLVLTNPTDGAINETSSLESNRGRVHQAFSQSPIFADDQRFAADACKSMNAPQTFESFLLFEGEKK